MVRRCIICDNLVLNDDENLTCCPKCGSENIPADPAFDINIKINLHELRILTIWADNYSKKDIPLESQKALSAILERIKKQAQEQLPEEKICLTLKDEFDELKKVYPNVKMIDGDRVYDSEKPS